MQIERLTVEKIEVDVDALMKRYGVSGLTVEDAGVNEARDYLSAYIGVMWDGDEGGKLLIAEPGEMGKCSFTDTDGAELSSNEDEFLLHIADIVVGCREP